MAIKLVRNDSIPRDVSIVVVRAVAESFFGAPGVGVTVHIVLGEPDSHVCEKALKASVVSNARLGKNSTLSASNRNTSPFSVLSMALQLVPIVLLPVDPVSLINQIHFRYLDATAS